MPYKVQARQNGAPVQETRGVAASAVILASAWDARGYQDIVITTKDGITQSLAEARRERLRRLHLGSGLFA